jgi:hypothetical protein
MRRLFPILLLGCASAFGQLQTDTITITALRQVSLQPDQIVFHVQVSTPVTAGLDDAVGQVAGAGITAANLTGVFTDLPNTLSWSFTLGVPFSQAGGTTKLLAQIEQQSNQAVTFYTQGTQISQALQQFQPCSQASLISDARAQANSLAAAAGFTLGPVLAVSDGSVGEVFNPAAVARVGVLLSGAFISVFPTPPPVTCAAVVKFQLYRYH